ncbi:hypothetical protein [Geothrix sp. PMB-07]|uniref:hypothetical protein n=1 Tax=Geothrix sp. PMB-07 TaxID=3068640 RepID=UPI002740811B|nr:hypothetical protein [Geothrix sp. PMB-07]WLT33517.1 hypothetical protein Q9293_09305 [Geothrix sp. PMB-07]
MFPVLMLFLLPFGGGIPGGVLLAQAKGLPWPITAGLYLLSDVILALILEPILWLLVRLGARIPALAQGMIVMQAAMARSLALFKGTGAGPITFIFVAFGLDPMSGRAVALAAGHGFVAGWAFAIAGDMLYYGAVTLTTLKLNTLIKDPSTTISIVLLAMFAIPMVIGILRARGKMPGRKA